MQILSKASCDEKQLYDRINKGFHYIELQLLADFLEENIDLDNVCKKICNKKWDILSIHSPLIAGGEDINLEYFSNPNYARSFKNVCELTQRCADFYGHKITIIIHTSFTLRMFENIPVLFSYILNFFFELIKKYPDITFSLENVCPINIKNEYISLQNNLFFEAAELANHFNKVFNKKVFFTTLDLCHMMITLNFMENYKSEPKYQKYLYKIEDYFIGNSETINNIHFNNNRNKGMNKGEHSASFEESNPEDLEKLKYFLNLYKKYCPQALLTLEIDEEDYNNAILAGNLRKLILKEYNN